MAPSRSGDVSAPTSAATSERCRPWISSKRDSRASIAWARIRSLSDCARDATSRSRSRSGPRFHESLGPVTASDSARSMSVSSSAGAATAPAATAVGGAGSPSKIVVPIGSQPPNSRFATGTGASTSGGPAAGTGSSDATVSASAACVSRSAATVRSAAASPAVASPASTTTASVRGRSRSSPRAQRNSPDGGAIRTHSPACRPVVIRSRATTRTRSPASSATWETCLSALSCEPTRAMAPSVVMTAIASSSGSGRSATSLARTQLKLPSTGRTAQYPDGSIAQTSTVAPAASRSVG